MQNDVRIAQQRYHNVHRFDDSHIYSHCNLEQDIPCIHQKRHFASTRSRHKEQKCIPVLTLFQIKWEDINTALKKITVYLCCKWQCYDMRLNSSLTERHCYEQREGRAGQTMDNKITRRNKRNTQLSWIQNLSGSSMYQNLCVSKLHVKQH